MNEPILILLYDKRHVDHVVAPIREYRPERVYLSADGAKSPEGASKTEAARTAWCDAIDWPCSVYTRFASENKGCRQAVSEGVDWFFENEERGIIIEEDCLVSNSFLPFASEMLEHYASDQRIMAITAQNEQCGHRRGPGDYYFSEIAHCWGWATWKRAWKEYRKVEATLPQLLEEGTVFRASSYVEARRGWVRWTERVLSGDLDSWAVIWSITCLANNGLSIIPNVNMVENLGFGEDATHTSRSTLRHFEPKEELERPIVHPPFVCPDTVADVFDYRHCYRWHGDLRRRARIWVKRLRRGTLAAASGFHSSDPVRQETAPSRTAGRKHV